MNLFENPLLEKGTHESKIESEKRFCSGEM
jgi:hypothetical protein